MSDISNIQLKSGGTVYTIKDATARAYYPLTANSKHSIARGNDITSYFTDGSLYTRISSGTFDDLFIGDYFTASYNGTNKTFRIAGFNVFYNSGDTLLNKLHAVIVPDQNLGSYCLNNSSTTTGGYAGCYLKQSVIGGVASSGNTSSVNGNLYNIFGSHLLTSREYLSNSVDSSMTSMAGAGLTGASNGWEWQSCQAVLMSEVEVYGCTVLSSSYYDVGTGNQQLPLFNLMPQYKNTGYWYWLKAVANYYSFCYAASNGISNATSVTAVGGVRPRFLIG